MVTALNDQDFSKTISGQKGLAFVDFHADWCGPCKVMDPIIHELSDEMKGKLLFGEVDVDQNPNTANQFGVMSIPTLIFFKDGKEVDRILGAVNKATLQEKITSHL